MKRQRQLQQIQDPSLPEKWLFERRARESGYDRIAGVDEAGRGPIAGPVVAAACVLPKGCTLDLRDSKKLTASKRFALFQELVALRDYGIGIVDVSIIDEINILQATFEAMILAIQHLTKKPDYVLVDGPHLPKQAIPAEAIIAGDDRSASIAAASILAKVTRDQIMEAFHLKWPKYHFDEHKGYPTSAHIVALKKYGPCPIHRKTFAPVRTLVCPEV